MTSADAPVQCFRTTSLQIEIFLALNIQHYCSVLELLLCELEFF